MAYTSLDGPFFSLAKATSEKAPDRVRIGAVLTKGRKVLSIGFNRMLQTHPSMAKLRSMKRIHAELSALIGVRWRDLAGAEMFVYRSLRTGEVGMCRPCEHCVLLLQEAGVSRVFYTDPSQMNSTAVMRIVR